MADQQSAAGPGDEPWDQAEAVRLIGQYALIGITWLASDGETITSSGEYHGRIVAADREPGIRVDCEGRWSNEMLVVPPATAWFKRATPGQYTLKSTGEVVVDPDFTASWSIRASS